VMVVNRHHQRDLAATLDLGGGAARGAVRAWEVNGPDVSAMNSFEAPRVVDVRERSLSVSGARLEHTFPAHSITVLRIELA